jgi:hypothetical protein
MAKRVKQTRAWFKRYQHNGIYSFYQVHGGPSKTSDGYLVAVRFLSGPLSIGVEHNFVERDSSPGAIMRQVSRLQRPENRQAYERALDHPQVMTQ